VSVYIHGNLETSFDGKDSDISLGSKHSPMLFQQ